MVVLVFLLQTPQYGYGFCRCRLVHHHHLESPLQRLVGFEILLVLVQCGGTYGPEFAPCKCRLKYIGSIHSSGTSARSHQSVNLIYEEYDLAVTVHNLFHNGFQPLLEFSLVLGSGNHRTQIQRVDYSVLKVFRNVPVHNFLGNAF